AVQRLHLIYKVNQSLHARKNCVIDEAKQNHKKHNYKFTETFKKKDECIIMHGAPAAAAHFSSLFSPALLLRAFRCFFHRFLYMFL
ncbi:hypothetical protein ACJX0J_035080, partial [Zea mays]